MKKLTRFLNALMGQKAQLPAPAYDPRSWQHQFQSFMHLATKR